MTRLLRTPDPQPGAALRVSVVVTNYNYGHYLGACLASLRAQTSPADEIVVVDDGSTDGSRALLAGETAARVVLQENAGQAAAFNAGFAATTGDVVIFLDADDLLYPEAIAVVRALWTGREAILCWRLDTVDAAGRKTGRYEKWAPDLDMLPRLLDGLLLPFMPTSANAFSREAIAWSFPLPAARWRISADALLVRAGVLAGPMRPVAQVLGGYRIHGGNNYHRGSEAQTANIFRGLNDIADAGLDLVEMAGRAGRLERGQRVKLLASALRVRLRADAILPDAARFRVFLARLARVARQGGPRLALAGWLAARLLPRSAALRQYVREPACRPRGVQGWIERVAGAALATERYAVTPRRAPHDGPPAEPGEQGGLYLPDLLEAPEWERDWVDGSFALRAARGRFRLQRPPGRVHDLRLSLAPAGPFGLIVKVMGNGLPLANRYVTGQDDLLMALPPRAPGHWAPDEIEILVEETGRPGRWRERWRQPVVRLKLHGVVLTQAGAEGVDGVLPVLDERPMEALGPVLRAASGAVLEGETLVGPGEKLCLALPVLPAPYALVLRFAPGQGAGSLSLTGGGRVLFAGEIGPAQRIAVEIPPDLAASTRIELAPAFRPEGFLDGAELAIASLGWMPGRDTARGGVPALSPGEMVGPGGGRPLWPFLGSGWDLDENGAAHMAGATAELQLAPVEGSGVAQVVLDLEPLAPFAAETPPLVVVSVGQTELTSLRLAGRAKVVFGVAAEPVELAVHAAGVGQDGTVGAEHGGIVLHGIGLAASSDRLPAPVALRAEAPGGLIGRLWELRRAGGLPVAERGALRDALAAEIAAAAPGALWHLVDADGLRAMAELARGVPVRAGDLPAPAGPEGWLAGFALRVLAGPGHADAPVRLSLDDVPDLPEALARAVAEIVVADPGPGAAREVLAAYQAALVARLDEARAILAHAPATSARWALARVLVRATRPNALLFSDLDLKPHVAAFGRALEAMLLREGHVLGLEERSPRPEGARVRIGLLLRHAGPVPETWIARGVSAALPPERAEVIVFLTQGGGGAAEDLSPAKVISLAGRSVSETVAEIRAARLDVMLLGAAFHGYMPDAAFAAHRLAPRQIALAAAQYATTGLGAVDEMVIGALQAPEAARADCTEKVVVAPGTGQAFVFGAPAREPAPRERMRRRLGLDGETVLLTSGAMRDKIGPEVLASWIAVLAGAEGAVLALYPFAENWHRDYDQAGFVAEVRTACAEGGVDPARVIVLPPLGAAGVADMLAAADLYLAAFPFSGATTTVEALRAGLPVVARAERTQRGHQAAGWLEAFGVGGLVAATTADYVRMAAELAGSAEARGAAAATIRAAEEAALGQAEFRGWLARHVIDGNEAPKDQYRYFFHHVPKSGGMSLVRLFEGWFDLIRDYREPWGKFLTDRVELSSLRPNQMVAGHFWSPDMPIDFRYPELRTSSVWRVISFARDPLELALSEYFFTCRSRPKFDPDFVPKPLNEFLVERKRFYLSQFSATEENWREVLDRYWFIGTLERFGECVTYLADAMGKPRPENLPVENVTPRSEEPDPDAVAAFKANNATDYAIYEEVNRRLDRLLGG